MEYLSVKEMSNHWNMKERKVTSLCRENRIPGVQKKNNTWLIPSDSVMPIDKRTKEFFKEVDNKEIKESTVSYTKNGIEERVFEEYQKIYGEKPSYMAFAPYTLCPIGAHTDHNLGLTLSFAIDKGIHIAYSKKENGIIEITNLQFRKRVDWHVLAPPRKKENDWGDILRGATTSLLKRYPLRVGLTAVMDGELPIGGSSSSSALILSFINILAFLNNVKLDRKDLIEIATEANLEYVGVDNGKLNQYTELYSKKNALLYMDMKEESQKIIPYPKKIDFEVAIFFSGLDNTLSSGNYNRRVEELRCSSYLLKAYSGMDYGRVNDSNMREIEEEIYLKYKDKLPLNFQKRVEHFYEECKRVKQGVEFFQKGNIKEFGRMMNLSGKSSIEKWETGREELIKLYEGIKKTDGVYGTRFSGAGFRGCCIALINPKKEKEVLQKVEEEYLKIYPELKGKYSSHICKMSDKMLMIERKKEKI